jgi:transposase
VHRWIESIGLESASYGTHSMRRTKACPRTEPLNVVGIDDWAFRRNHSYGTIVCDLERRRIVTLLPDLPS